MTSRLALLTAVLIALIAPACARAADVPLYGRFEAAFEAVEGTPAFSELAVEFESPAGQRIRWPGFYDGGRTYRVRFMPVVEGQWKYRTISSAASLADKTGTFNVKQEQGAASRLRKHGPVRVSKDGYRLEHRDGTPFFFLADTCWNGALLSRKEHWDEYLRDRLDKHFTAVQFVILSPWRTAPKNAEGLVGYSREEGKPLVIHPEFYQRIDERMEQVDRAGLLSVPVLMWAWGQKDAGRALPEEDARRIIEYQVARYAAFPVVWILNGDGDYRGKSGERWRNIGRAVFRSKISDLKSQIAHHAPVTYHPGGRNWPYGEHRDEAWLDVWGYQSSHSDNAATHKWIHSGPVSKEWRQFPKVYMNLEPPYEDHIIGGDRDKKRFDAASVRRACWWSMLAAPPAGLTYGGHGIWSWQEDAGPPFDHAYTGVAKRWQEAKDLPAATSMKHLSDFFTSIDWPSLRPAPQLLAAQPGEENPSKFISAAGNEAGTLLVLYLPAGGEVSLREDAVKAAGAKWYDPRTGHYAPARGEGGKFKAPTDEDWVLLLR